MISRKSTLLGCVLFLATSLSAQQPINAPVVTSTAVNQKLEDDSFDFDHVTEQMIETGIDQAIQSQPPSKIMVWVRTLGMPFVMKFAEIYEKCTQLWSNAKQ